MCCLGRVGIALQGLLRSFACRLSALELGKVAGSVLDHLAAGKLPEDVTEDRTSNEGVAVATAKCWVGVVAHGSLYYCGRYNFSNVGE